MSECFTNLGVSSAITIRAIFVLYLIEIVMFHSQHIVEMNLGLATIAISYVVDDTTRLIFAFIYSRK